VKKNEVHDKTAIVTGSRRGIGCAIVLALAREGADVVVSDISREDVWEYQPACLTMKIEGECKIKSGWYAQGVSVLL